MLKVLKEICLVGSASRATGEGRRHGLWALTASANQEAWKFDHTQGINLNGKLTHRRDYFTGTLPILFCFAVT